MERHATHIKEYRLYFFAKDIFSMSFFNELALEEYPDLPKELQQYFSKNLNYNYNSNTLTYRLLVQLIDILKERRNIIKPIL